MARYLLGDRRNDLRVQLRLQAAYERRLQKDIADEFGRMGEVVAEQIRQSGGFDPQLGEHAQRVRRILESSYNAVMPEFGQRILDAASDKRFRSVEIKQGESEFDKAMHQWIRTVGATQVKRIHETTKDSLQETLEKGRREGMGTDELARLVRDETPGIGLQRAALIARTEMHNAAQAANMQAAEATGIQGLKKEWLAAEDKRTRPDHNDADGQVVEKEGQFTVGASQMDRPGDQSAPPRQTVNCRCALSFITPEDT